MGDLIRGHTYSEGDLVTPDNLHALVENATIKDGVITTSKIADEAITSAKLASNLAITANKISLSNGKLLVGNASNVGAEYSFDEQFELDASNQKVSIKDGGIGDDQLAAISGLTAGTYNGSVSVNTITIPKFTVNSKGRITSAGTDSFQIHSIIFKKIEVQGSSGGLPMSETITIPNPWASEGLRPGYIVHWLECIADDSQAGYLAGDRIPGWFAFAFNIIILAPNNDIRICGCKSSPWVLTTRYNYSYDDYYYLTPSKWKIVLYVYPDKDTDIVYQPSS